MPANPVLLEIARGDLVESRHRGAVAVVDAKGETRFAVGDLSTAVYPRSAIKAIQALPLLETGAAHAFRASEEIIALACASHSGSPRHTELVAGWLQHIGLSVDALGCGAHWPLGEIESHALAASGVEPGRVHNNCSGKHAGFLTVCQHLGETTNDYLDPAHPVQQRWRDTLQTLCDCDLQDAPIGTDGCGIPVIAVPLKNLALAAARFAVGHGNAGHRAAMTEIRKAIAAHPDLVAGSGRFDTEVMRRLAPRVLTKSGAEGVHMAMLPDLGLGVAVKIDDGTKRAAEAVMATVLGRYLDADGVLGPISRAPVRNYAGTRVGEYRPTPCLSAAS